MGGPIFFTTADESVHLDDATRADMRGSYIRCADGVTHYELAGPEEGPLVLLAGGLTIPLYYWDDFAAQLHAHGFRTLAYSGFGRGYSDRVRGSYDADMFDRQLADLVERLQLAPRHVVGSSLGAVVAMRFALHHPELESLSIIGPAGLAPKPMPLTRLLRRARLGAFVGRHLGPRMLRAHMAHNVRAGVVRDRLTKMVLDCYRVEGSMYALCATLASFPLARQHELYRRVGELGIPIALLWGDDDQVTPAAHLAQARGLLSPAACELLEGCGHMVPLERPDASARIVAEFMGREGYRNEAHEARKRP
ncbi:alpha/beta fold hydrolase [Microbacterium fluvii]|uniref:Alpha/beta fold hydrolase n=1 Tax=Microbacterium fluvii TaxID=415215 RepID=A0ABW2HA16_9MICO|nr:alpha/beta fold hydrolase [Microbacterium fluvii]MCU4671817.1 alpha/beta fold hydrolase [Microbacterium fluvii]